MKTFIMTLAIIGTLTTTNVQAAETCEDQIKVTVNGLVCDFCARALEKVFGERDDVNGIKVDMDSGLVTVDMQPGQSIDDETLIQLIIDAGYNVREIQTGC